MARSYYLVMLKYQNPRIIEQSGLTTRLPRDLNALGALNSAICSSMMNSCLSDTASSNSMLDKSFKECSSFTYSYLYRSTNSKSVAAGS